MLACAVLVLALCVPGGLAYSSFREQIPNGDHVPHPCKPNFIWHGVGHTIPQGGGARNPFGEDFDDNGYVWNEALCRKDSDGDGKTNGEELGDPNCVWSTGQTPQVTTGISHPGVCDPWNEGQCIGRNDWLDCNHEVEFTCDPINEPDVRNITLRFPRTKVPAQETSYFCFNFELPSDQEYHLIATKPFIDNHNVMHHMILSSCASTVQLSDKPQDCLMGPEGCGSMLGAWSLGLAGECFHPMAGYRFGKGGATMVSLQHHWTNPSLDDTWYDSSGITLYYTPKLRQYDSATVTLGQSYLSIPPGQASWVHEGSCSSRCSRKIMKGDVQLVKLFNHMHYLGIRQNVTLRRAGGGPVETIIDDNPFSYDKPVHHQFNPAITIHPGDELMTACTFQSRSRAKTTLYGQGSFDEMCFSFLSYFPAENIREDERICAQYRNIDSCDLTEKCDLAYIANSTIPEISYMLNKILDNCDHTGHCRTECPAAIAEVRGKHACFGDMWEYTRDMIYKYLYEPRYFKFAVAMESCNEHDAGSMTFPTPKPPMTPTSKPSEPHVPAPSSGNMFLDIIKHVDARPLLQNIVMNVNYNYGSGESKEDDHAMTWH